MYRKSIILKIVFYDRHHVSASCAEPQRGLSSEDAPAAFAWNFGGTLGDLGDIWHG